MRVKHAFATAFDRRFDHQHLTAPACRGQLVATLASASLHSYDETAWNISPAPGPDELLRPALGIRTWELSLRWVVMWAAFWLLVLFYAPVVALIQAPVNMDNLRKVRWLGGCDLLPRCWKQQCLHCMCWQPAFPDKQGWPMWSC